MEASYEEKKSDAFRPFMIHIGINNEEEALKLFTLFKSEPVQEFIRDSCNVYTAVEDARGAKYQHPESEVQMKYLLDIMDNYIKNPYPRSRPSGAKGQYDHIPQRQQVKNPAWDAEFNKANPADKGLQPVSEENRTPMPPVKPPKPEPPPGRLVKESDKPPPEPPENVRIKEDGGIVAPPPSWDENKKHKKTGPVPFLGGMEKAFSWLTRKSK